MFDPKKRPPVDGDALRAALIKAGLLRPNPRYTSDNPDGPTLRKEYATSALDDAADFITRR